MLQISADLAALTHAQREALSSFIISFPTSNVEDENEDEAVRIPPFSVYPEEPETPEEAFTPIPAAPPPAASAPAIGPNLDKSGLPWDERIHSSNRAKTADGNWRRRRSIDDALIAHVEAELKALMGLPAPAIALVPAPPTFATVVVPDPPATATVAAAPPAPPAPAGDPRQPFVDLIAYASKAIEEKKLTQDDLTGAAVAAGIPTIALLVNRPDLVSQVRATLEVMAAGR